MTGALFVAVLAHRHELVTRVAHWLERRTGREDLVPNGFKPLGRVVHGHCAGLELGHAIETQLLTVPQRVRDRIIGWLLWRRIGLLRDIESCENSV